MDELSEQHRKVLEDPDLLELRETAQRSYAWVTYLKNTSVAGHEAWEAQAEWERTSWELDNELERLGFERTEDLDAPVWAAPLDDDSNLALWPPDDPSGGMDR